MKTTLFSTVIAIMFATGFASCKKEEPIPPRACIAYSSPATINLGETVSFTNCSQNASSAKWEVTPTGEVFVGDLFNYTPTVAGAVTIKLTATNAEGKENVAYQNITVVDSKAQFLGNYTMTDNCTDQHTVSIISTPSALKISNFIELGTFINAYNSGLQLVIPAQTFESADQTGVYTISGSGTKSEFAKYITINFSVGFVDYNDPSNDFNETCSGTLVGQ